MFWALYWVLYKCTDFIHEFYFALLGWEMSHASLGRRARGASLGTYKSLRHRLYEEGPVVFNPQWPLPACVFVHTCCVPWEWVMPIFTPAHRSHCQSQEAGSEMPSPLGTPQSSLNEQSYCPRHWTNAGYHFPLPLSHSLPLCSPSLVSEKASPTNPSLRFPFSSAVNTDWWLLW